MPLSGRLYTYIGLLLKMTQKRTQLCAKLCIWNHNKPDESNHYFLWCVSLGLFAENWSKIAFIAYSKPNPPDNNFPTAAGMVYIGNKSTLHRSASDTIQELRRWFLHWSQRPMWCNHYFPACTADCHGTLGFVVPQQQEGLSWLLSVWKGANPLQGPGTKA